MPDIQMRPATRDDIKTILALSIGGNASGRKIVDDAEDFLAPEYQSAWDVIEKDPNNIFMLAEISSEVIGCMQINILHGLAGRGQVRVQLEGVHIRQDKRGGGYGSQMIKWAIEFAREKNARMVQLTSSNVRKDAHRFYEKLGFEQTHAGFKLAL